MKFDFLLVTSWSEFDAYVQRTIAHELEQRGYDTAVLTPTSATAEIVGSVPTKTFNLDAIDADLLSLETITDRFEIPSLRHLCLTEQAYYNLSYEQAVTRAHSIASSLDVIFTDHAFRYAYQARGGELFRLLVHYRMSANQRYNLWNSFAPFDQTVSFSSTLDNRWDAYETVPFSEMSRSDRRSTREFAEEFREQKQRYTHETPDLDAGSIVSNTVAQIPSKISDFLQADRPRNLPATILRTVRKFTNDKINRRLVSDIATSRERCRRSRYVLFPLQFRDESRFTVSSPAFYDQQWIVEYLARSLPHGVQLFVKQHPNHVGQESPRWIKRLSQQSHVTFLNPELNAHYAIEHAEATVVTNNTVGFEALFYPSPLIVLGHAFYSETPAAITLDHIDSLPETLATHIGTEMSEEARLSSIYSLKNAVYDVPPRENVEERARGRAAVLLEFIDDMNI